MGRLRTLGGWLLLAASLCSIHGCGTAPTISIGAPSVMDTSHGPVSFTVTYTGAKEIVLTAAQVSLQSTGTAAATVAISGSDLDSRTVTLSNITGDGTLVVLLDEGTATGPAGQPAPAAGPSATVRVDNTAPTATLSAPSVTATNVGPITYTVTYDGATAISLTQANVLLLVSGTANATVDEVTGADNTSRTVTLSNVSGEGTLGISIPAGTAADAAGNLAPEIPPSATVTVDNTPPTLAISAPSTAATATGPVDYKVNYEGADTIALTKAKVLVNGTGTTGANLEEVTATGDNERTVTLSNIIGNGTLGISIAAGTATDAAGNPAPEAGPSATFAVNNVAPTLNISEPSAPETFEGPISFVITYADAETITLSPEDITLNSDGGVTALVAVTGIGNTERTVTLSNINGQGPASISIAGRTAVNSAAVQAGTAGPSATFKVNPLLTPGTGFTGPTTQPDPIGAPGAPGIDAKAIARWDVVPYQTFDGYFNVGVVAFHINDIDRVEFSVQGGPWTAVKEMTLNPETNVVEYWTGIDAQDFPDGPIEVRAVAYPKVGVPRILQGTDVTVLNGEYSALAFSNAHHSFTPTQVYVSLNGNDSASGTLAEPVATIDHALTLVEDGGEVVLLDAGSYEIAEGPTRANQRWITVRPQLPLTSEDIVIQCPGAYPDWGFFRQNVARMKWENVSFNFGEISQYYNIQQMVWFDHCYWYEDGGWNSREGRLPNVRNTYYATHCRAFDMLYGFPSADLLRDCEAERISGDVYQNSRTLLNCRALHVDGLVNEHHTDLYQMWGDTDNLVIYGLTGVDIKDTQAIFLQPTDTPVLNLPRHALINSAFVNLDIESTFASAEDQLHGGPPFSQIQSKLSHLYFRDVKLPGQRMFLRTDFQPDVTNQWFEAKDVLFKHVEFHPLTWETYEVEANWPVGVRFEACYGAGQVAPGK